MPGRGVPVRLARALTALLIPAVLLAGCSSPAKHAPPLASPSGAVGSGAPGGQQVARDVAASAPCHPAACTPGATQQLSGGYSVRLWSSVAPGAPSGTGSSSASSTPVLELLNAGNHVQWWVGRLGFGWAAELSCLNSPPPAGANCVVVAEVGSHAGSAEVVLLQGAKLVAPATASVVFDSGLPVAADLDADGRLDVLGVENDYRPSFANGHNFWTSYRLIGTSLQQTGCLPVSSPTQAPPTRMLAGRCPVIGQG